MSYLLVRNTFVKHADIEYDEGLGCCEIIKNIKIYGKDFIAFRNEYDGYEWWQFILIPEDNQPNLVDSDNISFLVNFEEEHITDIGERYTEQQTCHNFDVFCEVKVLKSKTWDSYAFSSLIPLSD